MLRPLLFLLTLLPCSAFAQFGVSYQYQIHQADDWNSVVSAFLGVNDAEFLTSGHRVEVDYWFKALPDYRLEMMPALTYSRATYTNSSTDWQLTTIGLQLNTNLYPFDLEGDCDCPVWSKSEPVFKKGFFVQLSPGVRNVGTSRTVREDSGGQVVGSANALVPFLGLGAGMDIGFSDLITVSPLVRYVRAFSTEWPELVDLPGSLPYAGDLSMWEFGVRLGIRLDQ